MPTKKEVWDSWIEEYITPDSHVPLFETDSKGLVQTKPYGKDDRPILKRSREMEESVYTEGRKVIDDYQTSDDTYDGLIYLMYRVENGDVIPLYVGKAGKYGREENLSANLNGLRNRNTSKFARWGDGYYYHIGDLSAHVLDHDKEPSNENKYRRWANNLFAEGRRLSEPVYFWTKAWKHSDTGLYYDFEVTLEHLEYQLIGMASEIYPKELLNEEGT